MSRMKLLTTTTRTTWEALVVVVKMAVVLATLTSPSSVALTPLHLAKPPVKMEASVLRTKVKAKRYDPLVLGCLLSYQ